MNYHYTTGAPSSWEEYARLAISLENIPRAERILRYKFLTERTTTAQGEVIEWLYANWNLFFSPYGQSLISAKKRDCLIIILDGFPREENLIVGDLG